MKQHLVILEMAAQGKLPEKIDSTSDLSVPMVQELVDAGYLKAIDAVLELLQVLFWNLTYRRFAQITRLHQRKKTLQFPISIIC